MAKNEESIVGDLEKLALITDAVQNVFPKGVSKEKPPAPIPSLTSKVKWACFQYSNKSLSTQNSKPLIVPIQTSP